MSKHRLVAGDEHLDVIINENIVQFEGESTPYTVLKLNDNQAVIRLNNKIFQVQILKEEEDSKSATVRINGKTLDVELKTETDLLIEKMGGNGGRAASAKNVKAPMPGLIVKIHLTPGEMVEKGQPILNFEAMKMENQLKSPGSGKIKSILVSAGDKVEKGQLLVELE